jgi:hypothetical protein
MIERAHYETGFKGYQFQWHYEKEQAVVKELKQYIRDTVADDKQLALDETRSVSEGLQTLFETTQLSLFLGEIAGLHQNSLYELRQPNISPRNGEYVFIFYL